MDIYAQIVARIVKEQESLIGPLALQEANKVVGIHVNSLEDISLDGNYTQLLQNLVLQYARLFGNASIELCKEVTLPLLSQIPKEQVPEVLRS